jgi:hypothetical protein
MDISFPNDHLFNFSMLILLMIAFMAMERTLCIPQCLHMEVVKAKSSHASGMMIFAVMN